MTSPLYTIKDWEKHFENSESKKIKSLRWVSMPNKHDGKGYRRLVAHPKSMQLFCAWNLLVQVASKMPTRGVLADEDGPLTTSDLSFMTGFPEALFETAFQVLADEKDKILWLVRKLPDASGQAGAEGKGMGGEGTEGNGREPAPPPEDVIPTVEEVIDRGQMANVAVPEGYCRHYHSRKHELKTWLTARGQLCDWPMEMRRWWNNDRAAWEQKQARAKGANLSPAISRISAEKEAATLSEELKELNDSMQYPEYATPKNKARRETIRKRIAELGVTA